MLPPEADLAVELAGLQLLMLPMRKVWILDLAWCQVRLPAHENRPVGHAQLLPQDFHGALIHYDVVCRQQQPLRKTWSLILYAQPYKYVGRPKQTPMLDRSCLHATSFKQGGRRSEALLTMPGALGICDGR